jgi:hypothetical protein
LGGLVATNVFVDFAENIGHGFLGRPVSRPDWRQRLARGARDGEALDGLAAFEIEITDLSELMRRLVRCMRGYCDKAAQGETEDFRE